MSVKPQINLHEINAQNNNVDVISLVKIKDWNSLNSLVICKDSNGLIRSIFGENKWDVSPYISGRKNYKTAFNFQDFSASPELTLEMKLIIYGWLYYKANRVNKAAKTVSLITRLSKIKTVYRFLALNNHKSLSALSDKKIWSEFLSYLTQLDLSRMTLCHIFGTINASILLQPWLQLDFGISPISSKNLAEKLSSNVSQQTLVIPEKIADNIYGEAINLVEMAYHSRVSLAKLSDKLHENYIAGKYEVDKKISNGVLHYLTNDNGIIINSHEYANQINVHQPDDARKLISLNFQDIYGKYSVADGSDFRRLYGQIITACYICCGAFSGMRDSELGELSPESYYSETINGRLFHMLQSKTFKFGEKKETWVTAPIVEKAISVATVLTERLRKARVEHTGESCNRIWLNQIHRSKPPIVICDWNERLRRFCAYFKILILDSDYQECLESNPYSQDRVKKTVKTGCPWPLTSHQFRRSLAFYTVKHRLGTTQALKQQFKHLYLQMTNWYANGSKTASLMNLKVDNELQDLLEHSKYEDVTNKFFHMVHSNARLSGSHGNAIMEMRNDIPYIYSSWDVIYRAVKDKRLTLHGTAHSYCKNGYDCDMEGVVNPAFCVNCKSGGSIIDETQALNWRNKHIQLTQYLSETLDVSPSVYAHCITQIRAAESVMRDFKMDFEPYAHPIEEFHL